MSEATVIILHIGCAVLDFLITVPVPIYDENESRALYGGTSDDTKTKN